VLVVGSGAAALSAAIAVVQAGGRVIVVEGAPTIGGTTAKSAGAYWIPNNQFMRAAGTTDPKMDAIRYMVRDGFPARYREDLPNLGIEANEFALIEAYYDNSAKIIESLEAAGAIRSVIAAVYDYFDHTDLNKAPRGRALVPLKPDGTWGRGSELVHQLKEWLADKPVKFLLKHRVTGIERNAKGEVIGLAASDPKGDTVLLRANKAVIGVKIETRPQSGPLKGTTQAAVVEVSPGSPASQSTLKAGDVITKVDQRSVTSANEVVAAVLSHAPGDKVTLTLSDGRTVDIVLGSQPSN